MCRHVGWSINAVAEEQWGAEHDLRGKKAHGEVGQCTGQPEQVEALSQRLMVAS